MKRFLLALVVILPFWSAPLFIGAPYFAAYAQGKSDDAKKNGDKQKFGKPGSSGSGIQQPSFNLQDTIRRLNNNPKYRGRVIGTRIVRTARGKLVEVQIQRSNDQIVVVYIDPRTGGVVGDSY